MGSIDQLNIEIKASSTDASQAINTLVKSLKDLNAQLGLKEGTKLTTILNTLSRSANSVSGSLGSMNLKALDNASKSASKATESLQKSAEQAEKFKEALSGISEAQKAFIDRKLFENAFGKSRNLNDYLPKQEKEPLLALPMFDKMLPAVVQTQSAMNSLYGSIEDVVNETPKLDAITQAFYDWKAGAIEAARTMEQTGASFEKWSIPEAGANASFTRESLGWVSDIKPEVVEGYFYEIEDAAEKCLPAIQNVGTTALALADQFKLPEEYVNGLKAVTQNAEEAAENMSGLGEETSESAEKASSAIAKLIKQLNEYKKTISEMEANPDSLDPKRYDEAVKGYAKASDALKKYKDNLSGISSGKKLSGEGTDILESLKLIGEELESLSKKFDSVAEKGIKLFTFLTTPMRKVADEYMEKFKAMSDSVVNFRKNFQAHMKKVSDFWKRTMRTFTFMIVRKVFTAILKEVGTAVQSLAMYSNAMGTAFNTDLSNMVADFQYLGRSIVSVFAPLLNYIAPIIDAIVDRIATLLSYIGMLIAALGGSSSFTKAKKNVNNYAESLDKANKSAKNLTMGIDELNIINENKSGSSKAYDGWEDAWEDVDIPQWIVDMSDWFKKLWEQFTNPLKEAWKRAKNYIINGFKTMLNSLKKLFGHIGKDFLEMWNQEKTIHMFEQMLKIVGDLMRAVRNLANQFDKAWQKGRVGLKIFENLRNILAIIVEHVRNISYYMIGWAKELDFSPMLESFELLTKKAEKVADFIGGVFEDIMIEGVLKYVEFLIEDAIPHLQETIAGIIDSFNFNSLRSKLKPVWSAIEEMLEQIHTGTTNALGNIGKEIARFTSSKDFENFLQRIADITKLITAERVEKVLTGIGKGILAIAKSVVKFVNSKPFLAFLEAISKWIDKTSTDQIAGVLEKIAHAIAGFKFAAFATEKLGGFFKFLAALKALKNLGTIASGFKSVGAGMGEAASGASALGAGSTALLMFLGVITSILELVGEFHLVKDAFKTLTEGSEGLLGVLKSIGELKIAGHLARNVSNMLGPVGMLISAITGINGALSGIDSTNFKTLTDIILSEGDTTVAQVKDWFSQTSSALQENVSKWKDTERNLVQGKDDIDNYSKTLENLEAAFSSSVQATAGMAEQLTGKYGDMTSAIDDYVDQSTEALAEDLRSKREYYEAQGKDVDAMITQLYVNAEEEKKIYHGTQETLEKAADAYSEAVDKYGENSPKVEKYYQDYKDALDKHLKAIESYRTESDKVDTSEAIEQIEKLGKSLDLSQYGNIEDASTDIKGAIDEISSTYESELSSLNETVEGKMAFLEQQFKEGRISKEDFDIGIDAIKAQAETDTNSLTETYKTALDFFDQQLATKLDEVKTNAETKWDEANPLQRFFMGSNKDAYVSAQMQNYVDTMLGETGLAGSLQAAFDAIPGEVEPSVTTSMDQVAQDVSDTMNTWDQVINADSLKDALGTVFDNAKEAVTTKVGEIKEKLPSSFEEAVTNATTWLETNKETFGENVSNFFSSLPEKIGTQLGFALGTVVSWGLDVVTWISENVPIFIDNIVTFFEELPVKIGTWLVETIVKFGEWKTNAITWITTEIPKIITELMKFFEELPGKMAALGVDIITGLIQGLKDAWEKLKGGVGEFCVSFVQGFKDALSIHSPSKEAEEIGDYWIQGLVLPFNHANVDTAIIAFAQRFITLFETHLSADKFTKIGASIVQSIIGAMNNSLTAISAITTRIFTNISLAVTQQVNTLGNNLATTILPTFLQTYILPFFGTEKWQPLFDSLMVVFQTQFETFTTWFDEAMNVWWEEGLLVWFEDDKWDEDIFTPLKENIQDHWDTFSSWWDTTMSEWWENQVKPWFAKELWKEQLNQIHDVTKEVFDEIVKTIKEYMEKAAEAVEESCTTMIEALEDVASAVDNVMNKLEGFKGFDGKVTFDFGAQEFATGGFPSRGSLFWAGEGRGVEMVGSVGGRTGVVSNDEITGIADAVYATGNEESELLGQLVQIAQAMLSKDPVVISDKDIARMNNSGQSKLGMSIIS